jgi:Rrf2 family protein
MLSLTKKTEYALISLGYLAERPGKTIAAREVAEAYNMPGPLVMNILKTLHHANLISSTRGTKGGYRLTADLAATSLRQLIEALEGPVYLTECVGPKAAPCPTNGQSECERPDCRVYGACPIMAPVRALNNRFLGLLNDVKLADLVVNGRKIEVPAEGVGAASTTLATAAV